MAHVKQKEEKRGLPWRATQKTVLISLYLVVDFMLDELIYYGIILYPDTKRNLYAKLTSPIQLQELLLDKF